MTRISLLLGTLLFSLSVLAQGVDLEVTIVGDDASARRAVGLGVRAVWQAESAPEDVVLEVDIDGEVDIREWDATVCSPGRPIRCTIEPRNRVDGGFYAYTLFPGAGTYTVTARITSSTPDPNPANNVATKTVSIAALPSLRPYGVADLPEVYVVDPGGPAALRMGVQNDGEPATNIIARATLLDGARFTGLGEWDAQFCTIVSDTEVECRFGDGRSSVQVSLAFVAPDRPDGGTFRYRVAADTVEDDFQPANDVIEGTVRLRRLFAVTNDADEGAGSLRQAILDARAECGDTIACLVAARAPVQLVVRPRTALPNLRGRMKLDGGPAKTVIDGSLLPAGDGLLFEDGCEFRVASMIVRNVKGHGIEGRQITTEPCRNIPLLTPMFVTNSELYGNERGVVAKTIGATITENVVAENVRAGVFADGGYYADISRNVVVRNGATGIFVRPAAALPHGLPPGAEIVNNFVHDNGEWGIARSPNGAVWISMNSVKGNRLYGIDYGLDLRTAVVPHRPEVLEATYDAATDSTRVRLRFTPSAQNGFGWQVEVFASQSLSVYGHPEAERPVARTFRTGELEMFVPGDLRGQWITATSTATVDVIFLRDDRVRANATYRYSAHDTSELSNAVQVQ